MALDMTTALTIRANVTGLQQIGGLQNGLKGVTNQSNQAATAMGRLKGAAAGALGAMRAVLPVIGVAAVGKFAKDNLDAADAMSKLSQRTGVAAPTLDKFRKVAELSDTSIEGLGKGFKTLASNMYDAQTKGTGPAADAFNKLGIQVADANGKLRASDEVMLDVADRFKAMQDGPEKAALAADIFGAKLGDELIPLLNSGGDAVRNMGTSLTQDFADKAAAFNDRLETMQEKFGDLALRITEALLPAFESIVGGVEGLLTAFQGLPAPVQGFIAAFAGLSAIALVFAPVISALTAIGPLLGGLVAAIGPIISVIGTLGTTLVAVFGVGPLAIVGLVVAAGVAIYAFRDQIGQAFQAIGQIFMDAAKWYKNTFIDPVLNLGRGLLQGLGEIFNRIGEAIKAPIQTAIGFIRGIVNGMLQGIAGAINGVVNSINRIINAANAALRRLRLPTIPNLPNVSIPQFAEGGVVNGPTLAMVGEGGEPEYIIPASKMGKASAAYLSGVRGPGVIPRFAEGGFVAPGNANVNIQTGPVTQMNGQNFVTTQDMTAAVRAGVQQTLDLIRRDGSVRTQLGLA
jgi:TP901 family phage tail tape measure protein